MRFLFFSALLLYSSLCLGLSPDKALQELTDGNQRFASGKNIHKTITFEEFTQFKEGQKPFAVIVGCSDSRVAPEIIFDLNLGDLFVVRIAGNVIGPIELDSIRFSAEQLGSSLILVLGHENCAAIKTALAGKEASAALGNIYPLIAPALAKCAKSKENSLKKAIECNVMEGVQFLKNIPSLAKLISLNQLKILGGYYDFDHGKVQIIEPFHTPRNASSSG
ncbi:MAG: carbonic anhydrase [Chlamydiales bacterium]|nr:carbonic anhydrase [Chlamydiales bacterium]